MEIQELNDRCFERGGVARYLVRLYILLNFKSLPTRGNFVFQTNTIDPITPGVSCRKTNIWFMFVFRLFSFKVASF